MHFTRSLLAPATLACLAQAGPITNNGGALKPRGTESSSFTVPLVAAPGTRRNAAVEVRKAYKKYGLEMPETMKSYTVAATNGSGSASTPANPQESDSLYLAQVDVGGQTLNLDFDTGSSDLWVFSTVTPANEAKGKTLYKPSGNAMPGASWQISYGDGSGASGTVYKDTVKIGDVTATSQAVEAATSVSSSFTQQPGDGLMGLAFSALNTVKPTPQKTFFSNVMSTLENPIFTTLLKQETAGTYAFGSLDPSYDVKYTNVDNSQGFWQFSYTAADGSSGESAESTLEGILSALGFGKRSNKSKRQSKTSTAIADTGTTLMLLSQGEADAYWKQVKSARFDETQGVYTYSCSETLPDYKVTIGGQELAVSGKTIQYQKASATQCIGGISSIGSTGAGFNIFGDVFLQNVYAVFDMGSTPRLGFAQQK